MDSLFKPGLSLSTACPDTGQECPFTAELLTLRNEVDALRHEVQTDALTGLYNFRFFSNILPLEMERTRRTYQPLSLVILDLDHFKQFNDRWGHELGNQALVHVAQLITLAIRKLDYACRFGGEEFVLVLPNTDLRQALNVAERLRCLIVSSPIEVGDNSIEITASLGVDEFISTHADTSHDYIKRVDAWLYQAKAAGRNMVKGPDIPSTEVSTKVTVDEKEALLGIFNNE